MDDNKMKGLLSNSVPTYDSENFHIKRGMSCSMASDLEEFFLSPDYPKNLNSYEMCEKWLTRYYWEVELLMAELQFLSDDRKKVAKKEKKPCYKNDDWCLSYKLRIIRQFHTLPSRISDSYLDTSLRSPDRRKDNEIISDWSDVAEGY